MNKKILLRNVRLSFPALWTKVQASTFDDNPNQDLVYRASFLFEPDSEAHKLLQKTINEIVTTELDGVKAVEYIPIKEGNNRGDIEDRPEYEDILYIDAKNKNEIRVIDKAKNDVGEHDGVIYPGCYVNAVVTVYSWVKGGKDNKKKPKNRQVWGISCSLNGVQFVRDGEPLGGYTTVSDDDFEDFDDEEASAIADMLA